MLVTERPGVWNVHWVQSTSFKGATSIHENVTKIPCIGELDNLVPTYSCTTIVVATGAKYSFRNGPCVHSSHLGRLLPRVVTMMVLDKFKTVKRQFTTAEQHLLAEENFSCLFWGGNTRQWVLPKVIRSDHDNFCIRYDMPLYSTDCSSGNDTNYEIWKRHSFQGEIFPVPVDVQYWHCAPEFGTVSCVLL